MTAPVRALRVPAEAARATFATLYTLAVRQGSGTVSAPPRLLLTGGTGRLGTELQLELPRLQAPAVLAPGRDELDVTDLNNVAQYVAAERPVVLVHAAAYTNVAGAETQRAACWSVNVEGTRNVVAAARQVGARVLLISTDYVFYGDQQEGQPGTAGSRNLGYREDDTPGPVRNYYALTKLLAEEAVRALSGSLIVRTSFRPREWPYPQAYDDLFTSQDYVDVIAPLVAQVIARYVDGQVPHDTLHVATERKSVYELARRRAPDVRRASRESAAVELPADVSLNIARWQALRRAWAKDDA